MAATFNRACVIVYCITMYYMYYYVYICTTIHNNTSSSLTPPPYAKKQTIVLEECSSGVGECAQAEFVIFSLDPPVVGARSARVRLSSFENYRSVRPTEVDITWPEFVEACREHVYTDLAKSDCPLVSPAEFNGPRSKANVVCVNLIYQDFDGLSDADTEWVLEKAEGYACFVYTTYSHAKKPNSFRLVILPTRSVLLREYASLFLAVRKGFRGLSDAQCSDPSRMYIEPYAPIGTESANWFYDYAGRPLDVDTVLASAPLASSETPVATPLAEGTETLTRDHLTALAMRCKRRAKASAQTAARALPKIRDGLAFAEKNHRDDTIMHVVRELIYAYPECSDVSLTEVFEPSIALMLAQDPGAPDMSVVRDKITRARKNRGDFMDARVAKQVTEKVQIQLDSLTQAAYTPEQVAQWALDIDPSMTPERFAKHWIYQCGSTYYFRFRDTIVGPRVKPEMSKNATVYLAPAHALGVDAYTVTQQGTLSPKTPEALMEDYGTPLSGVEASLTAQHTHYDITRGVLVEAVRPLRTGPGGLTPAYSPEVDGWLRVLGGTGPDGSYVHLVKWLALSTDLRYPLPAIYFDGLKNGGKSLFAQSLARLWTTTQATPAESLVRSFNSAITGCPVVFADEFLPVELQGQRGTGRLREMIASRDRMLTRKHIPDAPLVGCIRMVLAANNPSLLGSEEHLTDNDIAAITERFLYVYVGQASVDYLAALPDIGASFREGDVFARHVLHLAENPPAREGRFGVVSPPSRLHRSLMVSSGARATVCNWLVGALLNRSSLVTRPKLREGVRVIDGALHVVPSILGDQWDAIKTHTRAPSATRIGTALAALSDPESIYLDGRGFRRIRTELLLQWCLESGYADANDIMAALAQGV